MKSPPAPPHIKEGASAQMLLLLEGRAQRNLSWARFGIQCRGLQKWEVLQVICFAGWGWGGWSLGLGFERLLLAWSRLASWYSSGWVLGAVWTDPAYFMEKLRTSLLTLEYQKVCRAESFLGYWSLLAYVLRISL